MLLHTTDNTGSTTHCQQSFRLPGICILSSHAERGDVLQLGLNGNVQFKLVMLCTNINRPVSSLLHHVISSCLQQQSLIQMNKNFDAGSDHMININSLRSDRIIFNQFFIQGEALRWWLPPAAWLWVRIGWTLQPESSPPAQTWLEQEASAKWHFCFQKFTRRAELRIRLIFSLMKVIALY